MTCAPPRAVALTFDNLGAASEQARGTWCGPDDRHPSVDVVLPWLLDTLDRHALRATFFVEAVNVERHPDAVRAIAARGHELGQHGWAHERWGELSGDRQAALLERSVRAFASLGLETPGFRPPGGALDGAARRRLRGAGMRWASPEGGPWGVEEDGLTTLPFRWPLVDATYRYPPLDDVRRRHGLPALDAAGTTDRLLEELRAEPDADPVVLVAHPMLMATPDAMAATERLLATLAGWRDEHGVSVLTGGEIAARLVARGAEG
jgi:peptidoglycan/xylan/chitin deacetylase (PgdA/CDA1 family)